MDTSDIPGFFQEETEGAFRAKANWLEENLGLNDHFLSKVLREEEATVKRWKGGFAHLSNSRKEVLQELWRVVLYLLADFNYDEKRLEEALEQAPGPIPKELPAPLRPPWAGSSFAWSPLLLRSHSSIRRLRCCI